jgi:2-isopropylmalate synthase
MTASDLWQLFAQTYLLGAKPVRYVEHHLFERGASQGIRLVVEHEGETRRIEGEGNGPIDAAVAALRSIGVELQVRSYEERSMGGSRKGGEASASAYVEVTRPGAAGDSYGVGVDANIVTASIKALVSGANRLALHRTPAVSA